MNSILDYDKETDEYSIKGAVFENELISWAQFFFTHNIYIVGLGLYECDMDLWWLIAFRKQMLLNQESRIKNKIVYYYLYTENNKNQNFKDCLESMDIEVRELRIDNNAWENAYLRIAENIKADI